MKFTFVPQILDAAEMETDVRAPTEPVAAFGLRKFVDKLRQRLTIVLSSLASFCYWHWPFLQMAGLNTFENRAKNFFLFDLVAWRAVLFPLYSRRIIDKRAGVHPKPTMWTLFWPTLSFQLAPISLSVC